MNMKIKGRNWWGKRPKNSWSAKNKMHSILKAMRNGEDMTHDLSDYKVVQIDDRVEVYKDDVFVGECEAYELDAVCQFLNVDYEERDE